MGISLPYRFDQLELRNDILVDPLGTVRPNDVLVNLSDIRTSGNLLRAWEARALADLDSNTSGELLGAGAEFGLFEFTRDVALSGLIAVNRLRPYLMRSSLRHTRLVRAEVGWRCPQNSSALDLSGMPFKPENLDQQAFRFKYRSADLSRRTDDVVWLWAYRDLLDAEPTLGGDLREWAWLLETGEVAFAKTYDRLLDPADGLYRGQACFVDIMMCGYPSADPPADARDHSDFFVRHIDGPADGGSDFDPATATTDPRGQAARPWEWRFGRVPASLISCITLKAASTNALYVLGMNALAEAARRVGRPASAARWTERAESLAQRVRETFLLSDGRLAYFKAADGQLEKRLHALGTAFCVLAHVVEDNEARVALDHHPVRWWGVPLFHPFYEDNPHVYHNLSAWPFVDAFFHRARREAFGEAEDIRRWLALAGRACRDERGFRELTDARTGKLRGSGHQLWSAAGFLGALLEAKHLS